MKKNFKAALTVLFAAVLAFSFVPAKAEAATDNTAFLAYADTGWTYQWWGDPVENGVVATDADITGPGQYTVSLDFTGTADGKAEGCSFTAVMIQGGETSFPGYLIQYDAIQINGEDVPFTKNYTSCDADGKFQLRSNIYNEWAGDITKPENNPRTIDGVFEDASATIIDRAYYTNIETYSVTFTLIDPNASVEEDTAEEAADAADVPKTGVVGLGIVYGLGALATGAFALKRKQK